MHTGLRRSLALAGLILTCPVALADNAAKAPVEHFDIKAQSLSNALHVYADKTGEQVVFFSEVGKGLQSASVVGDFTREQALQRMLGDSGLKFERIDAKTVAISDAKASLSTAQLPSASTAPGVLHVVQAGPTSMPADTAQADGTVGSGKAADTRSGSLEEVIVTAQKREERLQDVPVPVTVLDTNTLVEMNQLGLQDYYASVPGLNVTPNVASNQSLSIRGITTGGGTNPTVGVTVDDVPYGSSTNLGGGLVVPDIDPGDLARIEVLRGPQGTLYGASSLGGLLKFVTADPSTEGLSGRVQAGVSTVRNGQDTGYNFRGSVNIPVSDTLAIRASGFTRRDPGYIDNPVLGIDGLNEAKVNGGRVAALWRPSDALSVKLSALIQESKGDGSSDVDRLSGLNDLQQNYARGVGGYDRKTQAYSATLNAKLGSVDLTSVSGYNLNSHKDSWDYSYAYGGFTHLLFGVDGAGVFNDNRTTKFSEEVRLSSAIGQSVEWLLGGFYTHEDSRYVEHVIAEDPLTGQGAVDAFALSFPTKYQEYALFADLTFHVTDRFDVQAGVRESEMKQTFTQTTSGPFTFSPTPIVIPEVESKANAFTYLVTPRFRISPDLMAYARFASGYRPGGPNGSPGGVVPSQYSPDKTRNYELGLKADFLEHALSIDASLYYIDWKDIQIQLINPATGLGYNTNGSKAKSQGVELSVESKPVTGLTIGAWAVWNDAELKEPFPPASSAFGLAGDRLPYSSRFSANVSVQDDFPLSASLSGFVGGAVSYVGNREGVFGSPAAPLRQSFAGYAKTDLRAGVKYELWTADVFVNNVTDKRGALTGGVGYTPPFGFVYIQPRTLGISLIRLF